VQHQQVAPTLEHVDGEELDASRRPREAVVRHAGSVPEKFTSSPSLQTALSFRRSPVNASHTVVGQGPSYANVPASSARHLGQRGRA